MKFFDKDSRNPTAKRNEPIKPSLPHTFDLPRYQGEPRFIQKENDAVKVKKPDAKPSSANAPKQDKYSAKVKTISVDAEVAKTLKVAGKSAKV